MLEPIVIAAVLSAYSFLIGLAGYAVGQSSKPPPNAKIKSLEHELELAQNSKSRYFNLAIRALASHDKVAKRYKDLHAQVTSEALRPDNESQTGGPT